MKRMPAQIWMVCIFITIPLFVIGQTKTIDSLRKKMWTEPQADKKLLLLFNMCEHHQSINKDSLYQYALMAKSMAVKKKQQDFSNLAVQILVNAYLRLGRTDSAAVLVDAELMHNSVNDPETRSNYFKLAALKADCFGEASNYKDALSELYKIINQAEQYKDSLVLAKNMSTIGVINYNLDHVPDAFTWYFKGLSFIGNGPGVNSIEAVLYINLAETYRWVEKTDSAAYYINKAIPLCEQSENLFYLTNALRIKANIYKENKQYALAEKTMLECIAIRERSEGKLSLSNEQHSLAAIFMHSGNIDKAIKILYNALLLSDTKGNEVDLMKISYYNSLAKCYQLKKDNKNYQETLEKIISAKDAFYQVNSAHAIAELETKYEVQKKESTIIKQKLDITQKNYWLFGSALFAIMASIIVWLAFKNYRRKQSISMQLALVEEKRLAARSIIDAEEQERKRIAADLHDNIGAYASAIRADVEKIIGNELGVTGGPLQNLQQHSQEIIDSLRDTIWVLNKENITITGISDRIKNYINKLRPTYDQVQFHINEDIKTDVRISSQNALNMFRIIQEALHNALKHSDAGNIYLDIISDETVVIKIADDGKGMKNDFVSDGNGLLNMQSRAREIGMQLNIISTINEGTTVILETSTTN